MRPVRTFEYIVVLKNKTGNWINIISLIMLANAVLIFLFSFINRFIDYGNTITAKNGMLLLLILGIIGWVVFCHRQIKRGLVANYRFALLLAAWGWFMHPKTIWLAVLYLVAAILERPVKLAPEYGFDDDEIISNSFPQKRYKWSEMKNVVLNSGMLTLDFTNNHLIQGEVNDEVTPQLEQEFNEYCKQRLVEAGVNSSIA